VRKGIQQVPVEPAEAFLKVPFLVENGNGHVKDRNGGAGVHGCAPYGMSAGRKARRGHRGVRQGS
jgi:hypothetical protein